MSWSSREHREAVANSIASEMQEAQRLLASANSQRRNAAAGSGRVRPSDGDSDGLNTFHKEMESELYKMYEQRIQSDCVHEAAEKRRHLFYMSLHPGDHRKKHAELTEKKARNAARLLAKDKVADKKHEIMLNIRDSPYVSPVYPASEDKLPDSSETVDAVGCTHDEQCTVQLMLRKLRMLFKSDVILCPIEPNGHCLYRCFRSLVSVANARSIDAHYLATYVSHGLNPERLSARMAEIRCNDENGVMKKHAPLVSWGDEYSIKALSHHFQINVITVVFSQDGRLSFEVFGNELINGALVSHLHMTDCHHAVRQYIRGSKFLVIGLVDGHYSLFDNFDFDRS